VGNAQRGPQGRMIGSGSHAQGRLFVLAKIVHVEIAVGF
jgi:hypothetical protein